MVNMVPLHRTEAAIDPKNPIKTSLARQLFEEQSKYPVASVYMNDLMQGKEHLVRRIKELKNEGARIIIFDSISQEDMDLIADAVIDSEVPFICVDPGSFTATVTRKLVVPHSQKKSLKILATIGSVNPVAKIQVDELLLAQRVFNVYVTTKELLEGDDRRENEIARVVKEVLDNCSDYEVCTVVGDGIIPENRIDFTPYASRYNCSKDDVSAIINNSFAEITYRILKGNRAFAGIYTSGGDITVAVSRKFKTAGIRLLDEVIPLAAYGEFISGEFDGLKVVTKGGMAGDKNSLNTCIHYLKERLYI